MSCNTNNVYDQTCVVKFMNYPNGKPYRKNSAIDGGKKTAAFSNIEYGGRGMSLEKDIEHSNTFYLKSDIAVIHKKPTPVQIVNVNYPKRSKAVINEAYFVHLQQLITTAFIKVIILILKQRKLKTRRPFL